MIGAVLRLVDRASSWCAGIAAGCLGIMTALMLAEVFARNLLEKSLTFSWEFSAYLMGAAFLFGAAYALRTGGHVRVSLLAEHVPRRAARALDIACSLVGIAVTGFVLYALGDMSYTSFQRGVVSFTPTQTPLIYPQGLLVVGAAVFWLQMLARLVRLLRGEPPDLEAEGTVIGSDR